MPTIAMLLGGTFNTEGGRPSGYFAKLATSLADALPDVRCHLVNGGTYAALQAEVSHLITADLVLWFADVPNDLPKLVPTLIEHNPRIWLVVSKNNRRQAYSREQLQARLRQSHGDLLFEFTEDAGGQLQGTLLPLNGPPLLDRCPDINQLACALATAFNEASGVR